MNIFKFGLCGLTAMALLGACDETVQIAAVPELPIDDPRQVALVGTECAIYFAAEAKLAEQGRSPNGSITAGCPAEAAARPMDINAMVSVPPITEGYPQTVYQRMLARGVPQDMADEIAKSRAFWDLIAQRDSLLLL